MSTAASENFICPITQAEMTDPVICADGITYERAAIEAWFAKGHTTSPMTRQNLAHMTLIPNLALRNTIEAMRSGGGSAAAAAAAAPAAAPAPATPALTPSITINRIAGTAADYAIEISAPEAPDATLPTLFIDVLDISGSMGGTSVDTSTNTSDAAHFSRADLVRHSVATQIELLRPQDKLALVLFDNNAEVALPPTQMTAIGRTAAKSCLPQIAPRGGTNIWTGLQRALTIAAAEDTSAMNVVIVLQTDGESDPSYNPPRGIPATFRAWLDSHPHVRVTLHTVGYGYGKALDMPLLRELATIGNGTVNYIADGSMVGTVFIHLLANLMSCVYRDLTLQVPEAGIAERIGFLQSGQTRHAVLRGLPTTTPFTVCVRDPTTIILETTADPATVSESGADFALARDRLLTTLRAELPKAETNTFLNSSCLDALYGYLVDAATAPAADSRIAHLLTDLREPLDVNKGQLSRAFGSTSAFQKWGRHYVPWVISGHENEWAINFKDESSKHVYGTATTRALVDRGDGIFTTLPPPKASIATASAPYGAPAYAPTLASMASVHSSAGPCFLGASLVMMADGTKKRCDEIQPGDIAAPNYKIRCVIRTAVAHADIVQLGSQDPTANPIETGGFTLWHPVYVNHAWRHPADLGKIRRVATDAIYNFVLDVGHVLLINDIMTCTMGHDFVANTVIDHPYFGKRRAGQRNIRDDLEADPGWATGYIRWQNVQVQHDAVTGYICGMTSTPATT
jgi:Mg-chelatase subunit ChlD